MAQAIVDPEQLRNFAMQLKRFSGLLADASGKLSQQMQQLATSWRDQEHVKFSADFEQEMKQLRHLVFSLGMHIFLGGAYFFKLREQKCVAEICDATPATRRILCPISILVQSYCHFPVFMLFIDQSSCSLITCQ